MTKKLLIEDDNPPEPIDSFQGEFRWLSNFWPCEVELDGLTFRSVEAGYVAAKTTDIEIRKHIQSLETSGKCKAFGKTMDLRSDWEDVRLDIMESLLVQKFSKDSELGNKLIETYPRQLIEGNYWKDVFWGVCEGKGKNNLGKLLMKIRKQIMKGNKNV